MKILLKFTFLFFAISYPVISDEIIQDSKGNYFLMKDDGTFVKLPKPKPGNKYIIKKIKKEQTKKSKSIFKTPQKKARSRTNSGIR